MTYCGADCSKCGNVKECPGCMATCGRPFGGTCIAAEYIKLSGREKYAEFKSGLLAEVNALLRENGIPEADGLFELAGAFVNLEYPIPSGKAVKMLDDTKIYLGCQIELADMGICCGAVADTGFILISRYSVNGSEPELVAYKKR